MDEAAFFVEEAVHVQEAVIIGVVGEKLALLILAAVVLAGDMTGDRRLKVKCRALAHSLVHTLGLCLGHGVSVRTVGSHKYCHQDQQMHGVVVQVPGVG